MMEGFEDMYGEPKAEWGNNKSEEDLGCSVPILGRFLMHVYASPPPDYSHLHFHVTDFRSNSFGAVKSIAQLDDMRDIVGIGGSWSQFIEYMIASLKSQDLKLVLDKHSNPNGPTFAKLVAQKSKGMPLISIPLTKLVDSAAIENMSFGLFESLKRMQNLILQERDSSSQLTKLRTTEKDSRETGQSQLEKRQKFEKANSSIESGALSRLSSNGLQDSPDNKQSARDLLSYKAKSRGGIPARRSRAKARGAILQDIQDDDEDD